ncbi:hypothetical protein CHE29_11675 [Salmonella enterica]|nr:hypothetical protein CHE29_11675 [Salmonella enterica]
MKKFIYLMITHSINLLLKLYVLHSDQRQRFCNWQLKESIMNLLNLKNTANIFSKSVLTFYFH